MFKKITAAAFVLSGVFSANLHAAPVELMNEFAYDAFTGNWTVAVDSLGPSKQVFVHAKKSDGTWVDLPLLFSYSAGSKEVWSAAHDIVPGGPLLLPFAVKYIVNGVAYWDNNGSQNYTVKQAGYLLGAGKNVQLGALNLADDATKANKLISGHIALRNIAFAKEVSLIYTTNNWVGTNNVKATFGGNPIVLTFGSRGGSYANPNTNGVELWKFNFQIPASQHGFYYIKYKVNGQIYYDNNFGANYKLN